MNYVMLGLICNQLGVLILGLLAPRYQTPHLDTAVTSPRGWKGHFWGRIGWALLFVGFLLQLVEQLT